MSSAAVTSNAVIVFVNESGGPYAVALDRSTGSLLWQSQPVATAPGDFTNASPVVANGLVVFGYSPPEGNSTGQGGFALLDAGTGAIVKETPTIPPADQAQGYAGGGLWSTPAFDPSTGYLYWGAGNPDSKSKEDPHTDAILKIDLNRADPAFGDIVAAFQGNPDQYTSALEGLSQTPACTISDTGSIPYPLDDPVCGQIDLDFGASPNLFKNSAGETVVGELQKSGVYYALRAATMTRLWSTLVGTTCQFCNATSTALGGGAIFGVASPATSMFSIGRSSHQLRWLEPLGDGLHFQPVSFADGVAYTVDGNGFLDGISKSGIPVLKRPLGLDTGTATGTGPTSSSSGIAVAESSLFVATTSTSSLVTGFTTGQPIDPGSTVQGAGAYVIAYRPRR